MLASIVLPVLFAVSGLFALGCIVLAWSTYGAQLKAIRAQLAGLDDREELTVRLALTETREFLPLARRGALKPRAVLRRQARPAARAAA